MARPTAVLYARVSSKAQVEGYSLDQQAAALREYCRREGYEVVEEVRDEGYTGAYLERPGLDRVRDLVQAGGVALVLAQDADRITRDPAHRAFLDDEFERAGCALKALDDWGDSSHEGELLKYLKGWTAKGERLKLAERSRRNRRAKARTGKVVGSHPPRYGFRFTRNEKGRAEGYEVDEERMAVVRDLFRMVGVEGKTLRAARKTLEARGIPSPRGKHGWHQSYLRSMILNDAYRPHTFEEVRELVPSEVAATLDPERLYGVAWYGKRRQNKRPAAPGARGLYSYTSEENPPESWVAIPVPDPGIPRGWVDAARAAIKDNRRPEPSKSGNRCWELDSGVMRCASCGRAMGTTTITMRGKAHPYYRCPKRVRDGAQGCDNGKNFRARQTEALVQLHVADLRHRPEVVLDALDRRIEAERARLHGDPEREREHWTERLEQIARKRSAFQDQQAEGLITIPELKEKLDALEDARETAEAELAKCRGRGERLAELLQLREDFPRLFPGEADAEGLESELGMVTTMSVLEEWGAENVAGMMQGMLTAERQTREEQGDEAADVLNEENGQRLFGEVRRRTYERLRLRVLAHPDGSLEVHSVYDVPLSVSTSSGTSGSAGTLWGLRRS